MNGYLTFLPILAHNRLAKVTVAIVIAKKYLLAMELDDQKELETPLVDKNVDDL